MSLATAFAVCLTELTSLAYPPGMSQPMTCQADVLCKHTGDSMDCQQLNIPATVSIQMCDA